MVDDAVTEVNVEAVAVKLTIGLPEGTVTFAGTVTTEIPLVMPITVEASTF